MSDIAIRIENLSKQYRLGRVGTGTLGHDLNRWWHYIRGKEDPYLKIGEVNDRAHRGKSEYVWALRDISFEARQGEVLGIIGRNGAGKSTLLKILSKVAGPTKGRVMAKGRIASLLEVGTGFHPELTGRENIFLNGALLGMTKQEVSRKLDEIVDFAGVERYLDTPVKRYSSGMTVRLGFAVAAFLEEEILIVDEVLAVGDAEFQKKAIGKMQEVSSGGGRTVLFVSHNMESIQQLCSKALILEMGTMKFMGSSLEAIDQYLDSEEEKPLQPLYFRQDRKGRNGFKFSKLEFFDTSGKLITKVTTGQKLSVLISYETKIELENIIVRALFLNKKGENVFVCNNYHSQKPFATIPIKGAFKLHIPKFPLPAGTYYIHLQCLSNMEIEDEIEFASKFEVEGGDFFGTGKIPKIKVQTYIDHEWSI
ncbi:MAG: ABC transporter ATP-binding protein [Saprospirales bacterium]|nr:ABC transporter ATP-binding protein [Saprospirales bacterium]